MVSNSVLTVMLSSLGNDAQVSCLTDLLFTSNDGLALALSEDEMLLRKMEMSTCSAALLICSHLVDVVHL